MSILKINDQNEIYYELTEPKDNRHTFVFVNALTGNTNAWNGIIGDKITDIKAGVNAGIETRFLINKNKSKNKFVSKQFSNLLECARYVRSNF